VLAPCQMEIGHFSANRCECGFKLTRRSVTLKEVGPDETFATQMTRIRADLLYSLAPKGAESRIAL
jgi:hypothetical protein